MDKKKKQTIEEIAKIIYKDFQAPSRYIAEQIYNAKYRKESDTAKEILTELLDFVNGWFEGVEYNDFGVEFNRISKDFAEKYGVDLGAK